HRGGRLPGAAAMTPHRSAAPPPDLLPVHNGRASELSRVPDLPFSGLALAVESAPPRERRVVALFGAPDEQAVRLYAVLAQGEEVREVAVGPVHAGVIEPGHFRLQCHGEQVMHLEISLGYQHRGVERALRGGPDKRTIHLMETLAGDTTIGHATAYCQVLEGL